MMLKKYYPALSFLIIIAAIFYSFYSLTPSKNTTFNQFSTSNALQHLKNISKIPHFTGSEEHQVVRNYLVRELKKLGLDVEIQEQVALNRKWRAATNVKNIVAKIKGSEKGKALLLLSHYDSNPHSSLGASDAGSGVAIILEGVTSFIKNNKQPKNDVIICFTDAEELGLLGATAFVKNHKWANNIGLVLNFEARGSGGPSYMLAETNGGNKNLIEAFQKANTPYPVANSLMYSIYKMLPNDTDLTIFRELEDIDGFNFAFIDDHFDYHTAQDSFERMDLQSFTHQVSYFTATFSYFANANLENLKSTQDLVYFNFPYFGLIVYPFSWVFPLIVICSLCMLVLLGLGFWRKKLTVIGILKGFIPLLFSLSISVLIAFYGWKILLKIHPQYTDILHGFTYNGYYYIAAFTAITIAVCFWLYSKYFTKISKSDLTIAPLTLWLLINWLVVFYLKGASFFSLPVFVLLLFLMGSMFFKNEKTSHFYNSILAVPILLIFAPFVKMFPVGLGLKMLAISAVFIVLLFIFLVPVFYHYKKHKTIALLFFVIGLFAFVGASLNSNYTVNRKKPNSILYVLNTNTNKAYWASYNQEADAFTKQFLGENPTKGSFDTNTFSSKYKTDIKLIHPAELKVFKKPLIHVIRDSIAEDKRFVKLQIQSLRNANKIELLAQNTIQFNSFKVNNEEIVQKHTKEALFSVNKGTIMSYFLTEINELIEIEFSTAANQKINIDVIEAKYDLFTNPQFNIQPRSNEMMPMPFVLNDATVIKTTLKF